MAKWLLISPTNGFQVVQQTKQVDSDFNTGQYSSVHKVGTFVFDSMICMTTSGAVVPIARVHSGTPPRFMWRYECDPGAYQQMDEHTSAILDNARKHARKRVCVHVLDDYSNPTTWIVTYTFDLEEMSQQNDTSGTKRRIIGYTPHEEDGDDEEGDDDTLSAVPDEFKCPITHDIMRDPVVASDGVTYERHAIEEHIIRGNYYKTADEFRSPMSGVSIHPQVYPNRVLKQVMTSD